MAAAGASGAMATYFLGAPARGAAREPAFDVDLRGIGAILANDGISEEAGVSAAAVTGHPAAAIAIGVSLA